MKTNLSYFKIKRLLMMLLFMQSWTKKVDFFSLMLQVVLEKHSLRLSSYPKYWEQKRVALAVASSGIAATLLPGGRTAHSMFKLPINMMSDSPTCNVSKGTGMAQVLEKCELIVWDECTLAHKKSLEALDRTLQDLRNSQKPMGWHYSCAVW